MTEPLVIEYAPGVSVDITKPLAEGRTIVMVGGGGAGGVSVTEDCTLSGAGGVGVTVSDDSANEVTK